MEIEDGFRADCGVTPAHTFLLLFIEEQPNLYPPNNMEYNG